LNQQNLNTLKARVKHLLEVSVNSRNSDASLVANYWATYDKHNLIMCPNTGTGTGNPYSMLSLPLCQYSIITQPSQIERIRRLVQEEASLTNDITVMGKYMPTDMKVLKRRRLANVKWREIINENKIGFIFNYNPATP
jgi:hypothetical protein